MIIWFSLQKSIAKPTLSFAFKLLFSVLCCLLSEKNTLIRYFIFFNFFIVIMFFLKKSWNLYYTVVKILHQTKAYVLTYSHLFVFKHFLCSIWTPWKSSERLNVLSIFVQYPGGLKLICTIYQLTSPVTMRTYDLHVQSAHSLISSFLWSCHLLTIFWKMRVHLQ